MPINTIKQMKWWGWGDESVEFSVDGRPDIMPFVKKVAGIDEFIFSERENKSYSLLPYP